MDDFNIDEGEAEAIILALQKKGALVATDDRNAIRACKLMKINFTTAIAILLRTFEKNLINYNDAIFKLNKLVLIGRYKKFIVQDAYKRLKGGD